MSEVGPSERDRRLVLEGAAQLLADGKPRTAREIAVELSKLGEWVDKSLVNSVLIREGKRQFSYDRITFTYVLVGAEAVMLEAPAPAASTSNHDRAAILTAARKLMADRVPRTAKEIAALLCDRGFAGLNKSLVNSVLAKEGKSEFEYDRASYQYRLHGELCCED